MIDDVPAEVIEAENKRAISRRNAHEFLHAKQAHAQDKGETFEMMRKKRVVEEKAALARFREEMHGGSHVKRDKVTGKAVLDTIVAQFEDNKVSVETEFLNRMRENQLAE